MRVRLRDEPACVGRRRVVTQRENCSSVKTAHQKKKKICLYIDHFVLLFVAGVISKVVRDSHTGTELGL